MTNTQIADLVRLKHRYAGGAFREPGATSASRRCEIENKHRKKGNGHDRTHQFGIGDDGGYDGRSRDGWRE